MAAAPRPERPELPTLAVLATAGHVDHGKTAMVLALTGMNCDRLPAEQERGMTIELGFAWLDRADGRVAFVDVPGHERFVRQMVAGVSGIDAVILVVAADEGVMPQTREHLDICQLLGIRHGIIALTRTDLVDSELMELALDDVRSAVETTFLADQAIVPFSIHDDDAPGRLRDALDQLVAGLERPDLGDRPFLLPIDRAFTRSGFGTVVTGTTRSGSIAVGDDVALFHPNLRSVRARVRGIERHGQRATRALSGQRVALNLAGIPHAIPRGTRIVHGGPGELQPRSMWDVRFALRASTRLEIGDNTKGLACCGSSVIEATLVLSDRTRLTGTEPVLAQLRLAKPLALLPGEPWIFRGFHDSPEGATLGGGVVLAPSVYRRRRGRARPELERLASGDLDHALVAFIEVRGEQGVSWPGLHASLPWARRAIDAAIARAALIHSAPGSDARLISPRALGPLRSALRSVLQHQHDRDPAAAGLTEGELRTRLRPNAAVPAFHAIIEWFVTAGELQRIDGHVALAGFTPRVSQADRALERVLLEIFAKAELSPPRVEALLGSSELPATVDQTSLDRAVARLVATKELVRVSRELVFATSALDRFLELVRAHFRENEWLDAQGLKRITGLSRKWLIPLAEWLDRSRVTARDGDRRRLLN